jgi:glycosyltransferase involved in cell wall biosynthesis
VKESLVSVIVPLYNYQNYISDCILSIKNQDYSNYELIVIDDCSTDKSYDIAKKFESANIKILKTDVNSGYSKAKNEGIIYSQGEMITCLDADDLLTLNSISVRVEAMRRSSSPMVHAHAINVKGDISLSQCYKIPLCKTKRTKFTVHAQTVLMKRWVYQKYGLYDEDMRSRSDKEMWWRLLDNYENQNRSLISNYCISDIVAYYRKHKKSMTVMRSRNKKYNNAITALLHRKYKLRKTEGITKENTRFLET